MVRVQADGGTAVFKAAAESDRLPRRVRGINAGRTGFLAMDADGVLVPSDW